MDFNHLQIRTLTRKIYDVKGVILPKGVSFAIHKNSNKITNSQIETSLIYLDNGSDNFEDFDQHIVNKKLLYDNSI